MHALRVFFPREPHSKPRYATHNGETVLESGLLHPTTAIHLNSKGFSIDGISTDWSVPMLQTFSGLTKFSYGFENSVSAFKFLGGEIYIRNALQRLVSEDEPEGQIYGGYSGPPAVCLKEIKFRDDFKITERNPIFDMNWSPKKHPDFNRETQSMLYNLIMGYRLLKSTGAVPHNDPAMLEVMLGLFNCSDSKVASHFYSHYVKMDKCFFNSDNGITFVFDASGFKVYDSNCLYMRENEQKVRRQRIWWEDWNQKVYFSNTASPLVENFLTSLESKYVCCTDRLRKIDYYTLKTASRESFEYDSLSDAIYNIKYNGEDDDYGEYDDYEEYRNRIYMRA